MKITVFKYQDLGQERLYEILKLRLEVFVVEQKCAYQDLDNKDEKALHLVGEENNKIIAYTRIFRKGDFFKNSSIGRVLVKKEYRNKDYGRIIMRRSIEKLKEDPKEEKIELSAQKYLLKFYSELGFEKKGEEYLEDNIPHVKMILKI
ncbi:GNAT family N-acetyltransferase [Flavobacteriaceae bacterium]|nr:GNAT family N-acetyltransferase [Paracoccaceae bacterium]MDA8859113.1 GNAT family N-acetyltransferase [Flavobacteriaceae bacterium]MDA8904131.1 GNAT family N-acetyltransferase [bacterium]MDA9631670.1 GNAT family N-acetyltransferase [Bacteroidota bacterium]MDA9067168.1 GNAT family N-acetyltransferase [Flavobacteriaceae bacterium]